MEKSLTHPEIMRPVLNSLSAPDLTGLTILEEPTLTGIGDAVFSASDLKLTWANMSTFPRLEVVRANEGYADRGNNENFRTILTAPIAHSVYISSRSAGAFELLAEKVISASRIEGLLDRLAESMPRAWSQRLANRLRSLFEDRIEEEPELSPMLVESLEYLLEVLSDAPELVYPDITLSPSGEILAEWRFPNEEYVLLRFFAGGRVGVVAFLQDERSPALMQRISADYPAPSTIDGLDKIGCLTRIAR